LTVAWVETTPNSASSYKGLFLIESLYMTKSRKPGFFYGYAIVVAAFFIMVVALGGNNSFGVFFKPVLDEFGWTRAATSGSLSVCLILAGSLSIGTGRLTDRFGPRLVIIVGGLFFSLGYLLMSQISTIWQLYLFYGVIAGIGSSANIVPLLSTIARWFVKKRGTMTGIVMAGVSTGTMAMPRLVGWLISSYGWRTSYIAMGAIALVTIVFAAQFLQRDPQSKGQLPDGETKVKQEGSNLEAGGLSFKEAICTRQLWVLWGIALCLGFCYFTILVHIVIHAIGLGISTTSAISILTIWGGTSVVGMFMIGIVGDRIGNKAALLIGFTLMSAALFWLLVVKELWMFYLFAAIFGYASCGSVILSSLTAELFGLRSHGTLFGFINTGFTVGATIGPVLAGYIFDVTSSYQFGFLIAGAVGVIGLILIILLKLFSIKEVKTKQLEALNSY